MTNLTLAASGADDWVQIIILILVFGGSAFTAVAKKIIQFLAERKAKRTSGAQTPLSPVIEPQQPRPVSRPVLPTAQAMPGTPVARRMQEPPAARRVPIRPVAPDRPAVSPRPVQRTPVPSRPAPPRRVPEPPTRRSAAPSPKRPTPQRPPTSAKRVRKRSTVADHVQSHISREHSRLEHEDVAVDATVDKHLGGLRRRMASADDAVEVLAVDPAFGALSVHDLRKAIVLNEILSPPLALRESPTNW